MPRADREAVRTRIGAALQAGTLPRYPLAHEAVRPRGGVTPRSLVEVVLLTRDTCSACGNSGDYATVYTVPAGVFRFHQPCHQLWMEESEGTT